MLKRVILLISLSALLLSGCAAEEPVEDVVEVTISQQASEGHIDNITVTALSPVGGFNNTDDGLEIYPHYNNSAHIYLKKILISENGFWETIIASQSEDYILTVKDKYTLITTPTGVSYGYYPLDDEWALLAETRGLNSGYLRLVMDRLWSQDT